MLTTVCAAAGVDRPATNSRSKYAAQSPGASRRRLAHGRGLARRSNCRPSRRANILYILHLCGGGGGVKQPSEYRRIAYSRDSATWGGLLWVSLPWCALTSALVQTCGVARHGLKPELGCVVNLSNSVDVQYGGRDALSSASRFGGVFVAAMRSAEGPTRASRTQAVELNCGVYRVSTRGVWLYQYEIYGRKSTIFRTIF